MSFFWPAGLWPGNAWPARIWPAATSPAPSVTTRMSSASFPFRGSFPSLYNSNGYAPTVDFACQVIEQEWSGIFSFFSNLDAATQNARVFILEGYLVGWWLGDMYPRAMVGVQGTGGMPIASKSVGGVSVSYKEIEMQPALAPLLSNAFGIKAATIILSRPDRFALVPRGPGRIVPVLSWVDLGVALANAEIPAP